MPGQRASFCAVRTITAGDDLAVPVTLYESGVVVDVSSATAISAAIQDGDGNPIVAGTAQSSGASGASWGAGVVVAEFPASATGSIPQGDIFLEIQVTISGKIRTWPLVPLSAQRGAI